ncbi:MAG: hypothetical protein NC489_44335 [Ruminococcus flavefaciens]|nr:hypothetical protein [Ruminococcus flavefaciens]
MITIALDEQGDFENLEGNLTNAPVFIGGVVYDDCGEDTDYDNEKKRLQKYLQNVCLSVGCRYPQDLHYSSDGNNGWNVAKVKAKFTDTIKEFLELGTWEGEDIIPDRRSGKYYIFASLRGDNGKRNLLSADVSEVVRDDFASNLYVHMAEDVVDRLIFHNPVIRDIRKVRLELATRRVLLSGEDRTTRMKQYELLGFKAVQREGENTAGVTEYLLTNPDNYRTAIEREMLRCEQEKILVDRIGVKSIYYKNQKSGMDFLYLADAICSYLGFKIQGNKAGDWLEEFDKRSRAVNSRVENLIWGYDAVDDYFSKAWRCLEEHDYYKALSTAFEGGRYKGGMTQFYEKKWFRYIGTYVDDQKDISGFSMAVKKYHESIFNNNLNQEKLVYVFKHLEKMSENICFGNNKEEAELYDLYDSGVSAFIHNSNLPEAEACFEKTKQYAQYVATESYLRTRNKMVVFLCDNIKFEEALKLANENVLYHELLTDMKHLIFGEAFSGALGHAITLSQRAQVYAFLDDERAESDFNEALKIMEEGTPDRYITQSYLLHYYICKGMREEYEVLAEEFFGNKKSLIEQFNYIAKEGSKEKNARFSMKYALYVYVKALYIFYLDEIPNKLINKLKSVEKSLCDVSKRAEKQINGHPWEIIYKYLALIMISKNFGEEADEYKKKIMSLFGGSAGLIKEISGESINKIDAILENRQYKERYCYMYC